MGTNPDREPARYQTKWLHTSIIGMMMYLASNSCPEIQFDVHQCDRFTQNYQASHEYAIIHICCYLKDTQKKGVIPSPTRKLHENCYVDYDLAGMFSYEDPHYPMCARSRSVYVVNFSNCPILWLSKLQIEISLSSLHAEYVALSQSLRDLLPCKALSKETLKGFGLNTKILKVVNQSLVFEDNAGDIIVASPHHINPTSKFISVKYH